MLELLPLHAVHVDLVANDNAAALARRERYLSLMSPDEHERIARLVFERDRRRFLLTRALVRTMLSKYAAVAPQDWKFVANVHGRPELLDRPDGVPDLRFNLSHTDGLIACAVTIGREVGVDVEHVGRRITRDVPARFFAPREVAALLAVPEPERHKVFFDYWTLKEAYIKATGLGLSLPLQSFAFRLGEPPAIAFEPADQGDPAEWHFARLDLSPRHVAALAVRHSRRPSVTVREALPLKP